MKDGAIIRRFAGVCYTSIDHFTFSKEEKAVFKKFPLNRKVHFTMKPTFLTSQENVTVSFMYVTLGKVYLIDVGTDKSHYFKDIEGVKYYNVKHGKIPILPEEAVTIQPEGVTHPNFDVYYEAVKRHYLDSNILHLGDTMKVDILDYGETQEQIIINIGERQYPLVVDRHTGIIHVIDGETMIPRAIMVHT